MQPRSASGSPRAAALLSAAAGVAGPPPAAGPRPIRSLGGELIGNPLIGRRVYCRDQFQPNPGTTMSAGAEVPSPCCLVCQRSMGA